MFDKILPKARANSLHRKLSNITNEQVIEIAGRFFRTTFEEKSNSKQFKAIQSKDSNSVNPKYKN